MPPEGAAAFARNAVAAIAVRPSGRASRRVCRVIPNPFLFARILRLAASERAKVLPYGPQASRSSEQSEVDGHPHARLRGAAAGRAPLMLSIPAMPLASGAAGYFGKDDY